MTYEKHPDNDRLYRHARTTPKPCWICLVPTPWRLSDRTYQHVDCDLYWDGAIGDTVTIVRGKRVE